MIRSKIGTFLVAAGAAWSLHAVTSGNAYVRVSTSCADVLSIKRVGKDFHLLVTNANAKANVSISAENPPYKLVIPGSGSCLVSLGSPASYTVEKVQSPDHERDDEPGASGNIINWLAD